MKRNPLLWLTLGLACFACIAKVSGQNICIEEGPFYGPPQCVTPGANNYAGQLNWTSRSFCIGEAITPPVLTAAPTFTGSQIRQWVTFSCPEHSPYWQDGTGSYAASPLYFTLTTSTDHINIPSSFASAGTHVYYARVDGISSGGCPDILGVIVATVTITITAPAVITTQPANQSVYVGETATFTVVATGSPPLSYQWRFNSANISGATSSTLVLNNVQTNQTGGYSVVVSSGSCSTTSAVAVLTVLIPPYTILCDTSLTNFTFQSDTTYYICGTVNLYDTTTIEGGTVFKYANQAGAKLKLLGPLVCLTSEYRPAVFTSKDDRTVGDAINGSTGNPVIGSQTCLEIHGDGYYSGRLQYCRFEFANTAVSELEFYTTLIPVWNCQFVQCGTAFKSSPTYLDPHPLELHNVLIARCTNAFQNLNPGYGQSVRGEHVTMDLVTNIVNAGGYNGSSAYLTNSILTAVGPVYPVNAGTVNLYKSLQAPNGNGIYQTVGAGSYYLATGSTNRNAGTDLITPELRAMLRNKTTYPPQVIANVTFTGTTNLNPQAPRDSYIPDLGYHYDPIDYLVNNIVIQGTTILTNGVVLGFSGEGIHFYVYNDSLISIGRPEQLNRLVWYNTVQEQVPYNWGSSQEGMIFPWAAQVRFQFTDFARLRATNGAREYLAESYGSAGNYQFRDCVFLGGKFELDSMTLYEQGGESTSVVFTNCAFERSALTLKCLGFPLTVKSYSSLFRGGSIAFAYDVPGFDPTSGDGLPVTFCFTNNLFDRTKVTDPQGALNQFSFDYDYNAFVTNEYEFPRIHNVILTNSPVYQVGPLGNYYHVTNSPLINAGAGIATGWGLYDYTILTNQVKETNSLVDIGFHYFAVMDTVTVCVGSPATFSATSGAANGIQWLESTDDGVTWHNAPGNSTGASYTTHNTVSEDDGNLYQALITDPWRVWASRTFHLSVALPVVLSGPQNSAGSPGENVTLEAGATATTPLAYLWRHDGQIIANETGPTLTITALTVRKAGDYSVEVTGPCGNATNTAWVAVRTVITYGANADFSFDPPAMPSPTFVWKKNGVIIPGQTSGSYSVTRPPVSESGTMYEVVASSSGLPSISRKFILTVHPKAITITADNKQRNYGQSNPALTYQINSSGFVPPDTASVVSGSPVLGTIAQPDSSVSGSPYPIVIMAGSLQAANYSFNLVNGQLTINKVNLSVTADPKSKLQGDPNPPLTGTIGGILNNDPITAQYTTTVTPTTPQGTYNNDITPVVIDPANRLVNYNLTINKGTFTVNPPGVTIDLPGGGILNYMLGRPPIPLDPKAGISGGPFGSGYFNNKKLKATFTTSLSKDSLTVRNYRKDGEVFRDNFNRPDGDSLGAKWTEVQGDQDIVSSRLSLQTGGSANNLCIYSAAPCSTVNQYACVSIPTASTTGGNPYPYVVLRYADSSSGHYRVVFQIQENLVKWYYHANASDAGTQVGSAALVCDAGDRFGVTIIGTGNNTIVRVWKNPLFNAPVSDQEWDLGDTTPDVSFTNDPATAANSGKYLGLGGKAGSAGGIVMDTFSAGDIPVTGTATEIVVDTAVNGDGSQNIRYGGAAGTVIGTCKGGTPQEPLIIKFNSAATEAIVEAVFQNVCFLNTSTTPVEGTRKVDLTVLDQADAPIAATRTVTINGTCPGPNAVDVVIVMDKTSSMTDPNTGGTDVIPAGFNDTFTRADSDSLGDNWTEVQGDQDIASGRLSLQSGSSANNLCIYSGVPCGTINQYACVTIPTASTTGGNPYPSVVLRYSDASSGHYRIVFQVAEDVVKWNYHANSTASAVQIDSGSLTVNPGDRFGVTITNTGTDTIVRIWRNPTGNSPNSGTLLWGGQSANLTFSANPATPVDAGNYVGLGGTVGTAGGITFDDFYAGDIGPVTRLEAAKGAAKLFLTYLSFPATGPSDSAELISFCGEPATTTNPTRDLAFSNDRATLINKITALTVCDQTVYHPSLRLAHSDLDAIVDDQRLQVIIFLTDGEITGADPTHYTQLAKDEATRIKSDPNTEIRLITIGLGNNITGPGGTVPRALLTELASSPSDFWMASGGATLPQLYGDVANMICHEGGNHKPVLTRVDTLMGGQENTSFPISYAYLRANSDLHDPDLQDKLSFKITSITSGTLTKSGQPVAANSLLSEGETVVWTPASNVNGPAVDAFKVLANDTHVDSDPPEVQVKVQVAMANSPPVVNAGDDIAALKNVPVTLAGTVSDPDNRIYADPIIRWSRIDGPGDVLFGDASQPNTTATFTRSGHYVLKLSAYDGQYESIDYVDVDVCAERRMPLDVIFMLDISSSMTDAGRVGLAKLAMHRFIEQLQLTGDPDSDKYGYSPIGAGDLCNKLPLTTDPSLLDSYIDAAIAHGTENFEPALAWSIAALKKDVHTREARPVIFVISDFILTGLADPDGNQLNDLIDAAKGAGIRMVSFGFGVTPQEDPPPLSRSYWWKRMSSGDNDRYPITDFSELPDVIRTVSHQDCEGKNAPLCVFAYDNKHVLYNPTQVNFDLQEGILDFRPPGGALPVPTWTKKSGPAGAIVEFTHDVPATPTVHVKITNPVAGTYTLRLDAARGSDSGFNEVQIVVGNTDHEMPHGRCDFFTVQEDSISNPLDVLKNDGPDNENLVIDDITVPPEHGTAVISSDGKRVEYTPDANFNSQVTILETLDKLTYQFHSASHPSDVDQQVVKIRVLAVDDPVIANDDFIVVECKAPPEQQPKSIIDVLANDVNVDADEVRQSPATKGLTIVSTTALSPPRGQLSWTGGPYPFAVLRYNESNSRHYRVEFQVIEGIVRWTYHSSNTDPGTEIERANLTIAPGDRFATTISGSGDNTVVRIWKNPSANTPDSASEWDPGITPAVTFTANPATPVDGGELVGLGGNLSPDGVISFDSFFGGEIGGAAISDDFNDPDSSFKWNMIAGFSWIGAGTFNFVNFFPDIRESACTYIGTTLGSAEQYVHVGIPVASDTMKLQYTPEMTTDPSYEVTFTYTVRDAHGSTDSALVTIHADRNPDYPPRTVADNKIAWLGSKPLLDVLENDYDPNHDPIFLEWVVPDPHVWAEGDQIRFDPSQTPILSPGNYHYTYKIGDPTHHGIVGDLYIKLTPPGPAPDARDDNRDDPVLHLFVEENISGFDHHIAIPVLNNDVGTGLTLQDNITAPAHGTAALGAGPDAGKIVYTPAIGYYGPDSFSYTVTDIGERTDSANVTVGVVLPSGSDHAPVAQFQELSADPDFIMPVTESVVSFKGTATDQDVNDVFHYVLDVYSLDENSDPQDVVATFTGYTRVSGGDLGPIDLRGLGDGNYEVELVAYGGAQESAPAFGFISLQTGHKIGNLKFSETDLTANVANVPLRVVRSYDSLNANASKSGDFSEGWSYQLTDLQIEFDETRERVQDDDDEWYSRRSGGGRNIYVTLPDGRRAAFEYTPSSRNGKLYAEWTCKTPGINATLSTDPFPDDEWMSQVEGKWQRNPYTRYYRYDIGKFRLELADKTVLHIRRVYEGEHDYALHGGSEGDLYVQTYGNAHVSEIESPNGDRYVFNEYGVDHFGPGATTPTPVLRVERDSGRITAIRDRQGLNSDGSIKPGSDPAVLYDYENDNLVRVRRLRNRAELSGGNPTYDTTQYKYEHPDRAHLITSIISPRGIEVAKTLYDDSGRLSRIETPDKRWMEYHYDDPPLEGGASRVRVVDSQAHEVIQEMDAHGNVLLKIDPQHNRTSRTFDDHDSLKSEQLGGAAGPSLISIDNDFLYFDDIDQIHRLLTTDAPTGQRPDLFVQEYDEKGRLKRKIDVRNTRIDDADKDPFDASHPEWAPDFWMEYQYDDEDDSDDSKTVQPTKTIAKWKTGQSQVVSEIAYYPKGDLFQGFPYYAYDAARALVMFEYYTGASGERFGDLKATTSYPPGTVPAGIGATTLYLSKTSYTYDTVGNRLTETHWRYKRNPTTGALLYPGAPNVEANQDQITTSSVYDAQNRITESIDAEGGHTYTVFDADGHVESSTDRYGATTHFTYNALGELIQTEYADINSDSKHSIARAVTYYASFDDGTGAQVLEHSITEETHFPGDPINGTRTIYDSSGRPIRNQRLKNVVINLEPDGDGAIQKAVFVGADVVSETKTKYDEVGRVSLAADANGKWTKTEYDDKGRVWRTKSFVKEDGSEIVGTTVVTLQGYDQSDKPLWTLDSNQYADLAQSAPSVLAGSPWDVHVALYGTGTLPDTSYRFRLTYNEYDEFGRQTKTHFPSLGINPAYTESKYDAAGRKWLEIDADRKATAFVNDGVGRVEWVITDVSPTTASLPNPLPANWFTYSWAARQADSTVTHYDYDELGRLIAQTDGNQHRTTYDYDGLNRKKLHTLPDGSSYEAWDHDYTSPGTGAKVNKLRHRDMAGHFTLSVNDIMGRTISIAPDASLSPDAKRPVAFTYTATGNRATMTDGSGAQQRVSHYAYDELSRLRVKQTPEGTLYYAYDAAGNIMEISARRSYWGFNGEKPYVFSLNSLGSTSDRDVGAHMEYNYDSRDRLRRVAAAPGAGTSAAQYTYDASGNLKTVGYGNGINNAYEYNSRNQLRYLKSTYSTTTRAAFDYDAYDGSLPWDAERKLKLSGMRQGLAELIQFDGVVYRRIVAYDNDGLNRLRAERVRTSVGANWPAAWPPVTVPSTPDNGDSLYGGYDAAGNRGSRNSSGINIVTATGMPALQNQSGLTYDVNDRLFYTASPASYDANGNARYQSTYVSQRTPDTVQPASGNPDEYDYANRLIRRFDGSTEIIIAYDGDGNRISNIVNAVKTTYLVDDHGNPTGHAQVLEELDPLGNPTVTYVYGLDLISQNRSGTVRYYGYDGQGTTRYLTDKDGIVTDTYTYDAYGILTERRYLGGSPTPNNYLYAGEQWDPHLGMYYLRARYYHPDVGRFWTMDTFEGTQEDPLSLHKYLYAHANPVNGVDPSGHEFNLIGQLVTAALNAWTGIKTAISVYNAYDRARSILTAIQDLAFVVEAITNEDPDDDGIVTEMLNNWVKGRITSAATGLIVTTTLNAVFGVGAKAIGSIAGRFAKVGITQAGIQRAKDYYANHIKPLANIKRTGKSGVTVHFDHRGWPIFKPYLWKGTPNRIKIQLQGSSKLDLKKADEIFKQKTGLDRPKGYTWHHHQDIGTMELVEQAAHSTAKGGNAHFGALAIVRQLYGQLGIDY